MSGKRGSATHRKSDAPLPKVPAFTIWTLRIFGGAALICGAILSFYALFGLAVMNGWPQKIAWALPGSVDILTATGMVVAQSVPRTHPGSRVAHWCAGASLVITIACNVEYHALLPGHWGIGHVALVATGAVPAIVIELILIMQMRIGDGAALADQAADDAAEADAADFAAPQQPAEEEAPQQQPVPQEPAASAPQHDDAAADAAPQQQEPAAAIPPQEVPQQEVPQQPAADPIDPPAAPQHEPAAANDDTPATNGVTMLVPRDERTDIIIELIARHGRANISGKTVGEAFGKSRDTGIRALRDIDKLPDLDERVEKARQRLREAGEQVPEDPTEAADQPDRELVLA